MQKFNYDEILDPVKEYEHRYKNDFSKKASAFFEDIVKKSNVNEEANAKLVDEIKLLQNKLSDLSMHYSMWLFAMIVLIIILIIGIVITVVYLKDTKSGAAYGAAIAIWIPALVLWVYALKFTVKKIRHFKSNILKTQPILSAKQREAWDMMLPLNNQFQWETVNNLIVQTLPIFEIDRFFNKARLRQMCTEYGLEDFGDDCSVQCCQSGSINGNPWAIVDTLNQNWKYVTYHGRKPVSYKTYETFTDEDGKTRGEWVTRTQILHATYREKAPYYTREKVLIYGFKDDLKNLCFSRKPTNAAGDHGKEKERIKKVEKIARDTPMTAMANAKFEASFYAVDRNDERMFRKLYSASAQEATYNLLKDKKAGYGDDFSFEKRNDLNILASAHMDNMNISGDPKKFHNFDLKEARKIFLEFCEDYFRAFYFSFAPLLCSHIYQTHNWLDDDFPNAAGKEFASSYECESIANFMGERMFAPDHANTKSILKARIESESNNNVQVNISAKAFTILKCCAYVTKRAYDGRAHEVPVNYDLYVPISKDTRIVVSNPETADSEVFDDLTRTKEWADYTVKIGADTKTQVYRRGLAAFLSKQPINQE